MPDQQQNQEDSRCPANRIFNIVGLRPAYEIFWRRRFRDATRPDLSTPPGRRRRAGVVMACLLMAIGIGLCASSAQINFYPRHRRDVLGP